MLYFIRILYFILFVLVATCHISMVKAEGPPPPPGAKAEGPPQGVINTPSPRTFSRGEIIIFNTNTKGFKMRDATVPDPQCCYAPAGSRAHIDNVTTEALSLHFTNVTKPNDPYSHSVDDQSIVAKNTVYLIDRKNLRRFLAIVLMLYLAHY
jgi:hypothetical protein